MGFKYKLIEWYIEQRNRHGTGQAFFGFFAGLISFVAIAQVYLKIIFNIEFSLWVYIVCGVLLVFIYWLYGYFWDIKGCFIIENEFGNKRNDFIIAMRKKFNLKNKRKI